jgi:hypothetical protein
MELIERYLQAVNLALPRKQRDDVIKELTDEILSQVEEKETALGRPLTVDEQAALVKQLGHPMMLAARYRKQRYLISPAVFPIYWLVLRLILVIVFFGMAVAAVAIAATGQGLGAALGILARYPVGAISAFAWVTIVFVVLEYFQAKFNFFDKWDARTLPKLSKNPPKTSTTESAAALIFGAIFGVWWLVGLKHQFLIFGPGIAAVHFGPVWQTLYPVFVILVFADIVRHTVALLRPNWERGRIVFLVFFRAMNLVVLYFLINANDMILIFDVANPNLQPVMKGINHVAHLCLIVAAVMTVAQSAWEIYRYFGRRAGNGARAVVSL